MMANTYQFYASDNFLALRSGDGALVPWNPQANQPLDIDGHAGRIWKQDGSPIPDPYVAPPPTAEEVRTAQFNNDIDRQTIVTNLQNKTPDQIKQWINNNATDLTTTKQMLLRLTLLVAKTLRD
jgi:hypothetical protein